MGAALLLPRLRPDQWEIVQHPATVKAVCCGRRWGKSVMSGAVALSAASQGARVLWMAPTYKNTRPIWRWSEAACGPLVRRGLVRLNRTERTIDFPGSGGYLGVYSADNDVAVRGDWFNLAILDEAARIPETTWTEVVQPALADAGGDAILPSTPAGKNWFWREWQRGQAQMDGEIAAFTAPSSANPSPHIQRAAQLAKLRVPTNVYRQEWLAEFVSDSVNPFQPDFWRATETHEARRFDANDPRHTNACVGRWIAWDTAAKDKETAAYSACIVGELTRDYRLFIRFVWRDRVTFPVLLDRVERIAADFNADGKLKRIGIEDASSGIGILQTISETRPQLAPLLLALPPKGSKEQRADLAAVYCNDGDVWLPAPSEAVPWLWNLEQELYAFPDPSMPKDQVDAFAHLILMLSLYLPAGRAERERVAAMQAAQEQEVA
jgi:predicted phage terminase large subunit-like protein